MTASLKQINEGLPLLNKMKQGAKISRNYLVQIREHVSARTFESDQDEINFFKTLKPKFYSQWFYCSEIYKMEITKPIGNNLEYQKQYFNSRLELLQSEFSRHIDFYKYLRSGSTELDHFYFIRNKQAQTIDSFIYDDTGNTDTTFYDKITGIYWANEKMTDYINKRIQELDRPIDFVTPKSVPQLTWTESKSALIELIYAFKSKGSFNYGNATLKEITDYLQEVFKIEITNPTRDFQDILRRKTGYSNYIDELKKSYLKYIDSVEEKHFKR
jgi:hypothetical protein